jgi:phenylacetate-CoA ligase
MRITGRVDDMLIIRGINVFPSMIEHTLLGIPEVGQHFQIVVDRKHELDTLLVRVELKPEAFSDKITELMKIKEHVMKRLESALTVHADVELAEPGSLPRFEGKAKRVIDRRKM